jgi:hypothetical protein
MNVINSYLSTYGLWSAERVWIMGYGRVWSDLAGNRLGGREKVWLIGGYGLSQVLYGCCQASSEKGVLTKLVLSLFQLLIRLALLSTEPP